MAASRPPLSGIIRLDPVVIRAVPPPPLTDRQQLRLLEEINAILLQDWEEVVAIRIDERGAYITAASSASCKRILRKFEDPGFLQVNGVRARVVVSARKRFSPCFA